MTREEAREILQGAIKKPNTKDGYLGQAIDMAIKALEQETVIDKIIAVVETWHKEGTNWSDIRLMDIEDILDKYKAENNS